MAKQNQFQKPAATTVLPLQMSSSPSAAPSSPVVVAASLAAPVQKFYRVTATAHVPVRGAHYILSAGKVISSSGYDIEALRALGVPLEEVPSGDNPLRAHILT